MLIQAGMEPKFKGFTYDFTVSSRAEMFDKIWNDTVWFGLTLISIAVIVHNLCYSSNFIFDIFHFNETSNQFASLTIFQIRVSWITACLFTGTEIQAAEYLGPGDVIDRTQLVSLSLFAGLVDRNTSTCVPVELGEQRWLQSVFMFPNSSMGREISIEVVTKNVDDCSSISWTWFVESLCIPRIFIECQIHAPASDVYIYGTYSNCILTCVCKPTCDYLYLKYTHVPCLNQSEQQLCEVKLLYGDVEPEDSGLLP